ncbi:ADAM 17-like protease [Mytilus californianus]|uniref:ADAM 17-like protease n=1 Tax=Mytilus californianus TaxID=6549 RepID=UPI002245F476|nr:ADAM 17-like protease [Mytilus californianus]
MMEKLLSVILISSFCIFSIGADISSNLDYFETLKTVDINRRVRRSVDPHPSSHLHEIWFSSLGRNFHLYVKQTKVVSDDFKATVVGSHGVERPFDIDTGNFYTGTLKGDSQSEVQLHWERNDLHATIRSPDDTIYIEPSWRHIPESDNHSMIVYRHTDLKWKPEDYTAGKRESFCEMKDLREDQTEELEDDIKLFYNDDKGHVRKKRQTYPHVGSHTMCGLLAVADYYFFKEIGRSDKRVTGEYLIGMIGRVNNIYQKTVWGEGVTNLGFQIKEMKVHDTLEDPSVGDHYNMPNRPRDMDAVLDWFGVDHKKMTKFCLGHLFTYQQFRGKLGLAYIGSWRNTDPGGICSFAAYIGTGQKIAVNTGVSSFQNPGGSRALAAQALITVSHELGHNWGSEHDPDSNECAPDVSSNGKYIMYYMATTGYDANNQIFSPCSKRFIFKVVSKKGFSCFDAKSLGGRGLCGNGRIDIGEECDAGYEGDFCCDAQCELRSGAVCSEMNYACCKTCNVAPAGHRCHSLEVDDLACLGPSNCSGVDLICPAPIKLSNKNCQDGGTCQDGVCLDICHVKGKIGCICSGTNSCKQCCVERNGDCSPTTNNNGMNQYHQSGRPCVGGFCDGSGNCEKSDPPVIKRLFSVLEYLSVDKIAIFMKNNLVWTILLFSAIIWIIAIVLLERYDRKKSEEDKESMDLMNHRGRGARVILRSDDPAITNLGTRALKPRMRLERGRAELEDLAAASGFH